EELVVLGHDIDIVVGHGRRAAQRAARADGPENRAVGGVERGGVTEAVGRIDPAVVEADAAAEQGRGILPGRAEARLPLHRAGLGVQGADHAARVHRIDPAAADYGAGGETRLVAAAFADLDREGTAEGGGKRD